MLNANVFDFGNIELPGDSVENSRNLAPFFF